MVQLLLHGTFAARECNSDRAATLGGRTEEPGRRRSVVGGGRLVGLHVRDEASPVAEGEGAQGAAVGLLARVLAHVDAQVVLADEGGRTDPALEGLLARVAPQVPRQVVLQAGRVRAEVAREGPALPHCHCCKGQASRPGSLAKKSLAAAQPSPSNTTSGHPAMCNPLPEWLAQHGLLGDLHRGTSSTDRGFLECD